MFKKEVDDTLNSDLVTPSPTPKYHPDTLVIPASAVCCTDLQVIDELTTDLNHLSCQMSMVQKDFYENERPMEACLKILQLQNEILEKALAAMSREKEMTEEVCRKSNDDLKCQIIERNNKIKLLEQFCEHLEKCKQKPARHEVEEYQHKCSCKNNDVVRNLCEQLSCNSMKITSLETELNEKHRICRQQDTDCKRYKDELREYKNENQELENQLKSLCSQLSQSKNYSKELARNLSCCEEKLKNQSVQLNEANKQIKSLQNRICQMRKVEDDNRTEKSVLHNEIMTLREKQAPLLAKIKDFQEKMCAMQQELACAQETQLELKRTSSQSDFAHHTSLKRLQDCNNDTKREYNKIIEEYNKLLEEYEKLNDINCQDKKLIDSFREWKTEQLKSDKATEWRITQYEEHIKLLLEEKEELLCKIQEMHEAQQILINDLERLKQSSYSATLVGQTDNPYLHRLRQASQRMTQQNNSLREQTIAMLSKRKS